MRLFGIVNHLVCVVWFGLLQSTWALESIVGVLGEVAKLDGGRYSAKDLSTCPPCTATKRLILQHTLEAFWRHDYMEAFACACNYLLIKPEDGHASSIILALTSGKTPLISLGSIISPPSRPAPALKRWDVLGPINVGKLEHDADPTFMVNHVFPSYKMITLDVGAYILGMPTNATVLSELTTGGVVKWASMNANEAGEVGVGFPSVRWNELGQGLSTSAVFEFQGWARASTYANTNGPHTVSCSGSHTVYVRNNNLTRTLVGDVYRSGRVSASVDLRVGPVGIIVPLRGVVQTAFQCTLEPVAQERSIIVLPPQHVPDLLEFPEVPGRGYLLTSVFTLPVQNLQGAALTVEFSVTKPLGQDGEFYVREAKPLQDRAHGQVEYGYPGEIAIAPGQVLYLALELIPHYPSNTTMPFLSCRKNKQFQINVIPSRGNPVTAPIEFSCRRLEQSFSISFLDHDHSVTQAAVILPLEYHHPAFRKPPAEMSGDAEEEGRANDSPAAGEVVREYPVLLSMHGSGIAAQSHADAHKVMHPGQKDYTFGMEGFFVVAPARFGAHNWEHTGELSAMQAVRSLQVILRNTVDVLKLTPKASKRASVVRTALPLPQVRLGSAIASGHSMGAHGAWMVALNHPEQFSCLAPLSGWINKEEYGTANAFFLLDGSSAYVDGRLRDILLSAMSDTHADKLMPNVRGMDVYLRVGSADATTHPWYTRRMHRLLTELGVNSTYAELADKQHWWWDTDRANDGGVLNDPAMRAFYAHCRDRANKERDALSTNSPASVLSHCERDLSLTVVNPSTHSGLCGLRVLQQRRMMTRTTVRLNCSPTPLVGGARSCSLMTQNVRKLSVRLGDGAALTGDEILHVNGVARFDLSQPAASSQGTVEICWAKASPSQPVLCSDLPAPASPIHEKSLVNYGPARQVAAHPFCVVYGTPNNQALRLVLRDLAVYVANAHAAAYGTHVRVMSDLDYIASRQPSRPVLANIIFIGGPTANRLMSMICGLNSNSTAPTSATNTLPLVCRIPDTVDFTGSGFAIDGAHFADPEHSVMFTLPFQRVSAINKSAGQSRGVSAVTVPDTVGMGLCLHANSLQGYLHLTRLAWPVVPPMVRAPLELYMPDYMVLSGELWAKGMGAALKAGYWDTDWQPAAEQAYSNMFN